MPTNKDAGELNMRPVEMQKMVIYILALLTVCGALILWNLHLENTKIWALVMIIVLGGAAGIFSQLYPKYKKLHVFSGREPLGPEEIYARYYTSSGLSKNVVTDLWQEVAKTLDLPVKQLRPTDEFGKELGPYRAIDDDLDQLVKITAVRLDGIGKKADFSSIKTLDDYIRQIGAMLQSS